MNYIPPTIETVQWKPPRPPKRGIIAKLIGWYLRRKFMKSNMSLLSNGFTVVNVLGILAQILGFLPQSKYVLIAQAIIQALLPSLGGVGHKLIFSESQNPDKR